MKLADIDPAHIALIAVVNIGPTLEVIKRPSVIAAFLNQHGDATVEQRRCGDWYSTESGDGYLAFIVVARTRG